MTAAAHILATILASGLFFNTLPPENTGINVSTMCQDSLGCLWFGGSEGAAFFDGCRYSEVRGGRMLGENIQKNHIYEIICSSTGKIIAGHIEGIWIYDKEKNSATNHFCNYGAVTDIIELSTERYLVNAGKNLFIFDTDKGKFTKVNYPDSLTAFPVNTICRSGDRIYCGGVNGQIAQISQSLDHIVEISARPLSGVRINCILEVAPGHIYIGTEGQGIWEAIEGSEGEGAVCRKMLSSQPFLSRANVRSLCIDNDRVLWVGTKNGLAIVENGKVNKVFHDPNVKGSIPHDSVCDIMVDKQGTIWLGTYYGGVCYHVPHSAEFVNFLSESGPGSLNGSVVSDIVQDRDGSIWVGTNSGGLNHILADGRIEHIKGLGEESEEPVDIKSIFISPRTGRIYVGAERAGLSTVNRNTNRLNRVDDTQLMDIYAFEDNRRSGFFIGSTSGLFEYDETTGHISRVITTEDISNIKSLKMDSDGTLWIGKKYGVTALNWSTGKFRKVPEELRNIKYIEDIYESRFGTIWLSSVNGLFEFEPETGEVTVFTQEDGLPDNIVHGVEEDEEGNLWVSTNSGLCRLNPRTLEKCIFTTSDGLPANRFTSYAHCRASDGQMYFGGLQSLTHFYPASTGQGHEAVTPFITDISVNGTVKHIKKGEIKLSPDERDLNIEFTTSDFVSGSNGRFFYRLDNIENHWNEAGADRTAVYHKLKPGNYTFRLTYRNCSGVQSEEECQIKVKIRPHWYETFTARIILIAFLLLIVMLDSRRRLRNNKKEYKSQLEKVRNELLREFSLEFINTAPAAQETKAKAHDKKKFGKADEEFMRKAMEAVRANLGNQEFSVDNFAQEMNMSRSNLHIKIKSLFGVSPIDFIKTLRFNEACRLLLEKKYSISEIGYMTGYSTPSYFASAFHRFMGCTPSEYLAQHSEDEK